MSHLRYISSVALALIFLPPLVSGPSAGPAPSYVGSPVQRQRPHPIPAEAPVPMMQFPPLQSYRFEPVQTLRMTPASSFVDGSNLYRQNCAECHGHMASSNKRSISFSQLSSAVRKQGRMEKASKLKKQELHSIVDALR